MQSNGTTSIVMAAFNEGRVIAAVVDEVRRHYANVIVVDDGSTDDTYSQARAAGALVLRHPVNLGQGAALQTGIDAALRRGADYIVTFDSDGQHAVSDIESLLRVLRENRAEFALGSRFLGHTENLAATRRAMLKLAVLFTRASTGLILTDSHNGLRAFTRRGASFLKIRQNRMAHASEILAQIAQSRLPYVEVPVTIKYTTYSLGKGQRIRDAFTILLDLFTRRLYR